MSPVKTSHSNPEDMFLKDPYYSSLLYESKVPFTKSFSYDVLKLCTSLGGQLGMILAWHADNLGSSLGQGDI